MSLDRNRARQLLAKGELQSIFIEELGWDRYSSPLEITAAGASVRLQALAQKRGMVVYHCPPSSGESLPDYPHRRKIEQQVAKSAHEHLIVFTDAGNETQVWQWVKREPGKPAACREHVFHRSQTGDALLQKLEAIAFTLQEEERLSLTDVTRRTRAGFDVERVTKRFYDRFQKEHTAFLKFVSGITDRTDKECYASVMLNRLMFVYFIQRKGFLDGDRDYLRNRLSQMREEHGKDKFYSFYRYFLLRLFHEALGSKERNADLERLVGSIPYLNGGLFDVHELEKSDRYGTSIQIPDQAFERIFDYFDQYQWHLDERPLRADNEINPDVLGYIFEKYINQKQMGAYYTKEDITEYISKNTVLPFLFDDARFTCKVAFENPKGPTVWDLLRNDPDRYIHPAMRHGAELPLQEEIARGIDPPTLHESVGNGPVETLELRKGWNKLAPSDLGLPTETWREVVARRKCYEEIKAKLAGGEVCEINELITLNLNIRQFTQDVIENCEGPELLRALWNAIEKITVLDPTCGSGAFLFAALNILEPLYDACLDRMEAFVSDLDRSVEKHHPKKFNDFRKVLGNVAAHPNRRYFIFKSIILNNLYGVDIMEEAVEICKLRLFLKLAAQVDPNNTRPNLGIEPLPDIDFNIRSGNTLVGYATYEAVKTAIKSKFDFDNTLEKISTKAAYLQQLFDAFRARQVQSDGSVLTKDKQELRRRLKALDNELNRYLASEYGVDPSNENTYAQWLKSHQPFHWFVEFYGIVATGGFDVIVGNPPYVEYSKVRKYYRIKDMTTTSCGNLYALMIERAYKILSEGGRFGFIVQAPLVSTQRMAAVRFLLMRQSCLALFSTFDDRPSKLFTGIHHCRLAIVLSQRSGVPAAWADTTRYYKWRAEERDSLFERIHYLRLPAAEVRDFVPKFRSSLEMSIYQKLRSLRISLGEMMSNSSGEWNIYYKITGVGHWFTFTLSPPRFWRDGKQAESTRESTISFANKRLRNTAFCCLSSTLNYWLYQARTNCRDYNPTDIRYLPVTKSVASGLPDFDDLAQRISGRLDKTSTFGSGSYKVGGDVQYQRFNPGTTKDLVNEVDSVLAKHYGFTEEELDFIINYDVKYRTGLENQADK